VKACGRAASGYGERVDVLDLTRDEVARLVGWLIALGGAVVGWNAYLWAGTLSAEPVDAPGWLLPAIIGTPVALGFLGGLIVPRRGASWLSLLAECGVAAAVIAGACFLTFITINVAEGDPDHPFALGLGAGFIAIASFLLLTPCFGFAYALRTISLRLVRMA
jgi:hypothetical protein